MLAGETFPSFGAAACAIQPWFGPADDGDTQPWFGIADVGDTQPWFGIADDGDTQP
ncbi:hypothetical protein D3C77_696030 [compost metagenome]